MNIAFKNSGLRKLCEESGAAERKLGSICARKLRTRLADLEAANAVNDLAAGNPHPLTNKRKGQFALNLHGGRRLVFEPDHEPCPQLQDGGIDWSSVTAIRIVFIGDYHDG